MSESNPHLEHDAETPVPPEPQPEHDGPQTERPQDSANDHTLPGMKAAAAIDPEATVNLTGLDTEATVDLHGTTDAVPARDDAGAATEVSRAHLRGLLEALIFASDKPIKSNELAKASSAPAKEVKEILAGLQLEYSARGVQLDEVAGGWVFRTSAQYAPFVRDLTKQKPVKLTRAQIETLAMVAYRQPITRPELDDIRGVDSGPVLKLLLDRDLLKILGTKEVPGRPILYGTTAQFLEFFGLKSLKELPTLREFTELNEDSRRVVEQELGETLEAAAVERGVSVSALDSIEPADSATATIPPPAADYEDDPEAEPDTRPTDIPPPTKTADDLTEEPAQAEDEDEGPADGDSDDDFDDDDDDDDDEDDDEDEADVE